MNAGRPARAVRAGEAGASWIVADFVKRAGAGLLVAAADARAQPAQRVYRLGILRPTAAVSDDRFAGGIPRAMADRGYTVGVNLVMEQRFAGGDITALPRLAREFVAHRRGRDRHRRDGGGAGRKGGDRRRSRSSFTETWIR